MASPTNAIAQVSNQIFYANGNKAATPLVNEEVRNNPGIYPPPDVRAKLFAEQSQTEALNDATPLQDGNLKIKYSFMLSAFRALQDAATCVGSSQER